MTAASEFSPSRKPRRRRIDQHLVRGAGNRKRKGEGERRGDRCSFTDSEWREIDRACYRLARAFGNGSSWAPPTFEVHGAEPGIDADCMMPVRHRGRVTEQAGKSIDESRHCRRQHAWTTHGGVVNVSYAIPDPMGVASMTEAGLIGPFLLMLQVFALQDANAWIELEKLLHKTLPLPNKHWAGRDAMARIMYRRAEIGIDDRAIQIGTRASLYRRATREAELVLRGWLLAAATIYNGADDVRATKLGRTQGRGQSTESWWHPERPFIQRESKSTLNTGRPRTARTAQLVREHSIEVWNAATATTRERWEDGRRALWNLPTSAPA